MEAFETVDLVYGASLTFGHLMSSESFNDFQDASYEERAHAAGDFKWRHDLPNSHSEL